MNAWYKRINNMPQPSQTPSLQSIVSKAMQNPAAFVQEQFPDIPENIRNNPNAILNYLSQTRGQQFVQQMMNISGMQGRR